MAADWIAMSLESLVAPYVEVGALAASSRMGISSGSP